MVVIIKDHEKRDRLTQGGQVQLIRPANSSTRTSSNLTLSQPITCTECFAVFGAGSISEGTAWTAHNGYIRFRPKREKVLKFYGLLTCEVLAGKPVVPPRFGLQHCYMLEQLNVAEAKDFKGGIPRGLPRFLKTAAMKRLKRASSSAGVANI